MKTSAKDFQLFKTECQKWVDRFSLNDWEIIYEHRNSNYLDADASLTTNLPSHVVVIRMATDMTEECIKSLADTAKHEIIHLLYSRLSSLATNRYATEDQIEDAEEELAARLMNIIK